MRPFAWLTLELTLRGSTRGGTLYAILTNKGDHRARDIVVRACWEGPGGESWTIDEQRIEDLMGRDAVTLGISQLQRGLPTDVAWDRLVVRVRARNTLPRKRTLALAQRERPGHPGGPEPAVRYQQDRPCTSPDGEHAYQQHRLMNDGVEESWRVCRRCGLAHRAPLTPENDAIQRRIRAERSAREQRAVEDDIARATAEAQPRAARARPRPPPTSDAGDTLPLQVALWILQIDSSAPSMQEIEEAYRRLAKTYHPDKLASLDPAARSVMEERMRDLNRARDVLKRSFGGTSASP